jgi:hypothetical protein
MHYQSFVSSAYGYAEGCLDLFLLFLFSPIQHVTNQQKQRIKNDKTKGDNSNRWLGFFSSLTKQTTTIHYA